MSGFCGFTGNRYHSEDNAVIRRMMERIKHRGHVEQGMHADEHNISIGAQFSGAFDLHYSESRSVILVLDGQIYEQSEPLIRLYEEHGEDMARHLRGMFAFLIYDSEKEQIFAARDSFGIKPFYYAVIEGEFVFASEIKSLLDYPGFRKELNQEALEQYLSFQYSVLPETFFKGVFKLPPAHSLTFKDGSVTLKKYWDGTFTPDESLTLDACVDERHSP